MAVSLTRLSIVTGMLMLSACASFTDIEHDFDLLPVTPESTSESTAVSPQPEPVAPHVVSHGARDVKRVALTFDACSTSKSPSQYDERITKILIDENVPATIFLGGKWMEEHPEHTHFLGSMPQFELANHSYVHPHMTRVPDDRINQEIKRTQDTMYTLTGRRAVLFRAPYGEINRHLTEVTASQGLITIQYDLASGDADKNIGKQKLIEYVSTMAKNGSIIVMHINGRGWHTAEALPEIIARLRRRGFEFVTVGQLIGLQTEMVKPSNPVPEPTASSDHIAHQLHPIP